MSRLRLSACFSRGLVTDPLSGISPEGIDWMVSFVHPSEMFWRQLRFADFDVSEMSLASLLVERTHGVDNWVALPVFTMRQFFHTAIVVRGDSGIHVPADLKGRRVGVLDYQQTSALWSRAALQHGFGVASADIRWVQERPPSLSHGAATGFKPPADVEFTQLDGTDTLASMFARGELDASLVHLTGTNLVDRGKPGVGRDADVRPLFEDPVAEGLRYFASTGVLPANHCVVIRRSVVEANPWVVLNVFAALQDAKVTAFERAADVVGMYAAQGLVAAGVPAALRSSDPLPYGYAHQRATFETLTAALYEQGLVGERIDPDGIFAEQTRTL